ncbi:MAG: hypothetical protein AAB567_00195 [Patescibacteria group bacterium]
MEDLLILAYARIERYKILRNCALDWQLFERGDFRFEEVQFLKPNELGVFPALS